MDKSSSALNDGETSSYHAVFIDTGLDTHLVLIVSDSDTVFDLKKKIMDEHPLCFPDIGVIHVHALKVKRRGYFYHLSDSMFVRSAFHGVSNSWFLSVDASIVGERSGKPNAGEIVTHKPSADVVDLIHYDPAKNLSNFKDSSLPLIQKTQGAEQIATADHNADNHCHLLSLETNNNSDPGLCEKHDLDIEEYEDPLKHTKQREDSSRNVTGDGQVDVSLRGSLKNGSIPKERRKTKKRCEDQVHNHPLKEDNASACVSDKHASQQDNGVPDHSLLNEDGGTTVTHNMETEDKDITNEPCRISSSDANKRPDSEQQTNEVLKECPAVPGKHIEPEEYVTEDAVRNSSVEEASHGPVKKKRKAVRKDDNENSFKDSRDLICDSTKEISNPGIVYQRSSRDMQKGTNAPLDHVSTDFLNAGHLLTPSPSSGKKKRKRKSSKSVSQVAAAVPSFAEHDRGESSMNTEGVHKNLEREPDAAVVSGQNVQAAMVSEPSPKSMKEYPHVPVQEEEENNKITTSNDGDVHTTDAINVRNKGNSTEVAAVSAGKRVRVSEDHHAIAAEGNHPLSVREANKHNKDGTSRNENILFNDDQQPRNHPIPCAAEEKELSKNNASRAMPSANCTISNGDENDMNSKVVVTTDLVDANGNEEPRRSSKKKKKSKKNRENVVTGTMNASSLVGIPSSHPHEPALKDHSYDESRKVESLFPVVGNEESKTTANTSILDADMETANVIQNVLESLQDISKNSVDVEHRVEKSRKKTKRKRNSAANNLPELQTEDRDVSCKNATPLVNNIMEVEVEASSELTKKTNLVKTSSKHQLNGTNRENENNTVNEANPEGNNEGKLIQAQKMNFVKSSMTDEATIHAEVSCESDRTIINDNFVPSQHKHEIAAADNTLVQQLSNTKKADNLVKAGKDKKKVDVPSNGPSLDLESSLKLNDNQGNGGEGQAFKSSTGEAERSLTKGNSATSILQAKKKLPKVSRIDARAPQSIEPDVVHRKPDEATRVDAFSTSGMHAHLNKNMETVAASSSSLGSFKNLYPGNKKGNGHQSHAERRKASMNTDNGEVVNAKPNKSLLAKSGSIFKDDTDGSSDDEDSPGNSDSSTIAPSENSWSSNYSDRDSTARQNGLRKESARSNIIKSKSSMKLDTILRNSSRYKASKLTGSQLQLQDAESQPVEFVPESQTSA